MGLRLPQSAWVGMNPQQQFLYTQGVQPTGMAGLPMDGPMIEPSMATPEQQKALADLQAAQIQSFDDQRQGISDLQDYTAKAQAQEVQTDLTPLMALTDAWSGSKFAQSYKAPESGAEKRDSIAKLKEAINKAKGNLTGDELALLKAKLQAMTTQSIFGQKMGAKADDKVDKATQDDLDARDKMIKTEEAKKIGGIINFNNALNNYVATAEKYGDLEALTGEARAEIDSSYAKVQTEFAKAAGLGALSGPDLGILLDAVKPQTGIQGGINQIVAGGRQGLKKGVGNLLEKSKSEYDNYKSTLAAAYSGRNVSPVINNWEQKYKESLVMKPQKKEKQKSALAAGAIKVFPDGNPYKFKGGDVKDMKNWELAKQGGKK